MRNLEGRRILVTGASSGIGRASAEAISAAGGRTALLARSQGPLDALAGELEGAIATPGDVTDPASVAGAVDRAASEFGGIDGVVNSAGVVRPGDIGESNPEDWRLTFDVNVLGLLHVTAAVLPLLRREPVGDVVNLSSMSGRRRASTEMTVYSASKHAVHVISDGLRDEVTNDGIRVTIISPSFVRTPIFDDVTNDELRTRYQDALAAKGLEPSAVAEQVIHALTQPPGVDLLEIALVASER